MSHNFQTERDIIKSVNESRKLPLLVGLDAILNRNSGFRTFVENQGRNISEAGTKQTKAYSQAKERLRFVGILIDLYESLNEHQLDNSSWLPQVATCKALPLFRYYNDGSGKLDGPKIIAEIKNIEQFYKNSGQPIPQNEAINFGSLEELINTLNQHI